MVKSCALEVKNLTRYTTWILWFDIKAPNKRPKNEIGQVSEIKSCHRYFISQRQMLSFFGEYFYTYWNYLKF